MADPDKNWFIVNRVFPQRSPLSPTLYNVFMDEFAEGVGAVPSDVLDIPAVLFADDVLLTAKRHRDSSRFRI